MSAWNGKKNVKHSLQLKIADIQCRLYIIIIHDVYNDLLMSDLQNHWDTLKQTMHLIHFIQHIKQKQIDTGAFCIWS